uniref:Zinc finger protein unc-98 n=1 Tax=Loa loa TaxID=7209 RepID=A0A1I7V769_LOALO
MGIISNYQPEININAEPEGIILPSALSTTIGTTPLNLQTDTPSELFVHPTFYDRSATSAAKIPHSLARPFISSALKQIKHVDTGNEEKESGQQFTEKSAHNQHVVPDENLAGNVRRDESGFVFYKCRFCGLTYNYLTTLRAHERVHNIDEPYKCNRCSESFHYICELEYHVKQHSDLKGYKCECGRTFHFYTDLLYHKHPGDEESVTATAPTATKPAPLIPENDFPVPEFIEKGFEPKHPLKVYSDVRHNPYICQYCSKSYPNSRMLAYHMYAHRGERIFNPRASRYLMARAENSYISPGS